MTFPNLWGAPEWWPVVAILVGAILIALAWSYSQSKISWPLKLLMVAMKTVGISLLAICLMEPMRSENRPQIGANTIVVAADASRSMTVRDDVNGLTRAEKLKAILSPNNHWLSSLKSDYDLKQYQFGGRLESVNHFENFEAVDQTTSIRSVLETIGQRYNQQAMAGLVLLTDGNSTETFGSEIDWESFPPVYPVIIGRDTVSRDVRIIDTSINQSNFETAPISIAVELETSGFGGRSIEVVLLNDSNQEVERRTIKNVKDGQSFAVRFEVKPEKRGIHGYSVKVFASGNEALADGSEATLVNNQRKLVVDRGKGPHRILYITGRPNWEFKFLKRALFEDEEIKLVGLMRIANREPKFTFRSRFGESTNPLFRGFGNRDDEDAEQYDEPVLIRMGINDETELRSGFPKSPEEMFVYDAVVLDDIEADFFSQDQQSVIQQFVSARGGGLLMLGGQESFVKGKFDRTEIGEMLPVYVNNFTPSERPEDYRLELTREGWLQPWVRVRSTQSEEEKRLSSMPAFKTVNRVNSIKPGASVLAYVKTSDDERLPALVEQRFGKGRVAALLLGDFWRWHLKNENDNDDMMKAWRQMMRWLVSDVPRKVDLEIEREAGSERVQLNVRVRDETFSPLDNANVKLEIQQPDGTTIEIPALPSGSVSGEYEAIYMPRENGLFNVNATVVDSGGEDVGKSESGWVSQPEVEEFASVVPNRSLLEMIARKTGGEVIESNRLDSFVSSLGDRKLPFIEKRTFPWWHHWNIFVVALGLLIAEWGLRRWKGLA